jgi:hypothetical protein
LIVDDQHYLVNNCHVIFQASAPPPYSYAQGGYAPPPQQGYGPPPQGYGQGYGPPPAQGPPSQGRPQWPNTSTVVVQGGFDAGARFDGVAQANIPVSFQC